MKRVHTTTKMEIANWDVIRTFLSIWDASEFLNPPFIAVIVGMLGKYKAGYNPESRPIPTAIATAARKSVGRPRKSALRSRPISSVNDERLTTTSTIKRATANDNSERKTASPKNENTSDRLPEPSVFFIAISVARFADFAVERFM